MSTLSNEANEVYKKVLEQLNPEGKELSQEQKVQNETNAVLLTRMAETQAQALNRNPELAKKIYGKEKVTAEDVKNQVFKIEYGEKAVKQDAQNQVLDQGYDYGKHMSNNAVSAYDDGKMPLSKWTKNAILDQIDDLDDSKLELAQLLTLKELKNELLQWTEWHHTGIFYDNTDFYGINKAALERLDKKRVAEIKGWTVDKVDQKIKQKVEREKEAQRKKEEEKKQREIKEKDEEKKLKQFKKEGKAIETIPRNWGIDEISRGEKTLSNYRQITYDGEKYYVPLDTFTNIGKLQDQRSFLENAREKGRILEAIPSQWDRDAIPEITAARTDGDDVYVGVKEPGHKNGKAYWINSENEAIQELLRKSRPYRKLPLPVQMETMFMLASKSQVIKMEKHIG